MANRAYESFKTSQDSSDDLACELNNQYPFYNSEKKNFKVRKIKYLKD